MKLTIAEMKKRDFEYGQYWFSEGAMSFFNTKIESEPSEKGFFITSEYMDEPNKKRYSIRFFDQETSKVETIGDFRAYETLKEAKGVLLHVDQR
jgi:hypothetical protein